MQNLPMQIRPDRNRANDGSYGAAVSAMVAITCVWRTATITIPPKAVRSMASGLSWIQHSRRTKKVRLAILFGGCL